MFSAVVSVILEWCGMYFFYPDEGYNHAETIMNIEIGYLTGSLSEDKYNSGAIIKAGNTVNEVVDYVFINSGVLGKVSSLNTPNVDDGKIAKIIKELLAEIQDYLMAAIFIIIMFVIRLAILILSIPAFLLFGIVGGCDGLMQRDLRRWSGGNESGFIYHWAKRFALPVLITAWVLYLAIPFSIHPNLIITPFAVLYGLVVMVMASKFKKYL